MEEYFLQFGGWMLLPLGACLILWLLQIYIILVVHGRLAWHKARAVPETDTLPPLSVIITTRNQEEALKNNLPAILTQDYPEFEVIVVNDRSEDDTKWVLRDLEALYPRLKVVEIAGHVLSRQGKKFGVAMGIKAARYEHVVLTDVDCIPATDRWLHHMGAGFSPEGTEIVLGYVPLQRKKGILSALIRFDHFHCSVNYLSAALRRKAYMGLGQNMAYEKELFFRGKGFASHIHVTAGYDELFVNQHASRRNTRIAIHREAHVWKPMSPSATTYWNHRKLQREAARLYRGRHKFRLNLQAVSALLFYLVLAGTFGYAPHTWPVLLGLYLLRLILQYVVYIAIARKLRINRMLWFLPVLDLLHSFYLGMNWYGQAKKSDGTLGSY